ncbi:MAG: response regulator transcription factor [Gammaproteobacteria bacterium]|nr:response regulator transcription factor [Gammaproteobacteria bacterium]
MNPPAAQPISLLLVEDDALLRESLADYLTARAFQVTAVGTCLAAYQKLAQRDFAIAIIDLGLPDQDGQVLVEYLRHNRQAGIIVLTARNNGETRIACYRQGADLFFGKTVDAEELAMAAENLARRLRQREPRDPAATPPALWHLDLAQRHLRDPAGTRVDLTPRECRLLDLLARQPGQSTPRKLLEGALYPQGGESAHQALNTLIRRLRRKLGQAGVSAELILTDQGVGYRLVVAVVMANGGRGGEA